MRCPVLILFACYAASARPVPHFEDSGHGWISRTPGYTVEINSSAVTVRNREFGSIELTFPGGGPLHGVGCEPTGGYSNYFFGADPRKWRQNVPHYRRLLIRGLFPGIDAAFYGNAERVEYDFIVRPGADPKRIRVRVRGPGKLLAGSRGELVAVTHAGSLRQDRPRASQPGRRTVAAAFRLYREDEFGFAIEPYDSSQPLLIDPVILSWSTYAGGRGEDTPYGIAVDATGSVWVAGETESADFPVRTPVQPGASPRTSAFVANLAPDGSSIRVATFIGGAGLDAATALAIGPDGSVYVAGYTDSSDFPLRGSLQPLKGTRDAFVLKLPSAANELTYSTLLGGSNKDAAFGIAVDSNGAAYVAGYTASADFPLRSAVQAYRGLKDAFVTRLSPRGDSIEYSTCLGGTADDEALAIAVDASGAAYITGQTDSSDFPIVKPYLRDQLEQDAFVAKLSPSGEMLIYSTYLGGNRADTGYAIAVDASGSAYVAGDTESTNFPTRSAIQADQAGLDAFVAKLTPDGADLVYSTYLGGEDEDSAFSIAVDRFGRAWVAGYTYSVRFPQAYRYTGHKGEGDAFLSVLAPNGTDLELSTLLGGSGDDAATVIAINGVDTAYLAGYTDSRDFPVQTPLQTPGGGYDSFIALLKFDRGDSRITAIVSAASGLASVAADGLVTIAGTSLAPQVGTAGSTSLPTILGGISVALRLPTSTSEFTAQLIYVSPGQINAVMPRAVSGKLRLIIRQDNAVRADAGVELKTVAPGIFTADQSGAGWAAAQVLTIDRSGAQRFQSAAECDPTGCRAVPIDVSADRTVYLILYGTGIRNRRTSFQVTLAGKPAVYSFAGAQGAYPGLDQINVRLAPELAGSGAVDVAIVADGEVANRVRVHIR